MATADLHTTWSDRLGLLASAACAVQCALSGLALGALTTLGLGRMAHPQVERVLLAAALAAGAASLLPGWRRHRSAEPLSLFSVGLAVLLVLRPQMPSVPLEVMCTLVGTAAIMRAHWRNSRLLGVRCGSPRPQAMTEA